MIEAALALALACAQPAPVEAPHGWQCEVLALWPAEHRAEAACAVDSESGWDPGIRGIADPRDRGLWQLNSRWHPEATNEIAFDWWRASVYARAHWDWARQHKGDGWQPWKGFAAKCSAMV